MVEIAGRHEGSFFLQASLIESIFEREGDTSEIVTTTGKCYLSIWPKEKVARIVNEFLAEEQHEPD